mgnify:CR=1 FL=1
MELRVVKHNGLNWTKVGLKDKRGVPRRQGCGRLNWTKVGLKEFLHFSQSPPLVGFELD